jgi:3-phosphoshikimate 1-carboxyvinyltransferase
MKLHKKSFAQELTAISLPGSKSISHRVLIAAALSKLPIGSIKGLSDCDDTRYLLHAIQNPGQKIYEFGDGATPLHFYMAMASAINQCCTLTGSDRLLQRPHDDLNDLLEQCGAEITLLPGKISIQKGFQAYSRITADASRSSQHISAMMLVAPLFKGQKEILLKGKPASFPYIRLTASVLEWFGIKTLIFEEKIVIEDGSYKAPATVVVEPDWSSAAFFYSLVACEPNVSILLKGLKLQSQQGDAEIAAFYHELGVTSIQTYEGVLIARNGSINPNPTFHLINHPDCAPALLAACALLGVNAVFTGLENLALKESDRLQAMKVNLAQAGIAIELKNEFYKLLYHNSALPDSGLMHIQSHNDHRIVMAMAVFGIKYSLCIDYGDCVNKSFPGFWNEWRHWFQVEP